MGITIGTRLGSHEITELLGRGGMGEVYRARDTKLKRDVAIKILPEELGRDLERVARFHREAEVLASLNHPNIAGIYDVDEANGLRFLVLELVEGETLADRIGRGPIPIDEALDIAKSICGALEAAHEKGIIHRDLKPANIKITPHGKIKVLDFGLAKVREVQAVRDFSNSPTLLTGSTPGVIMGTAAYMSPEQAKGRETDRTSDLWSFGCVLYEMLTGKPAFDGETVAEIFGNLLKSEPDWNRLPADTPTAIRRLLRRCLAKNRTDRLHDVADARIEIQDPVSDGTAAELSKKAQRSWLSFAWGAGTVFLLCTIIFVAMLQLETPKPSPPLQATLLPPPGYAFSQDNPQNFAISPDSTKIAFVTNDLSSRSRMLWVRSLDSTTAQPLAGTEGAAVPFWSPDSKSIGFFATGTLKKINAGGGAVVTVAPLGQVDPQGGAWSANGTIVFTRGTLGEGLYQVSSDGGPVTPVNHYGPGEVNHRYPFWLPDGRHLLFEVRGANRGIHLLDVDTKDQRLLLSLGNDPYARYANGYLFYIGPGDSLMAVRFSPSSLSFSGTPAAVAQRVGNFTVSSNGLLMFQEVGSASTQLTWFTRDGKEAGRIGNPGQHSMISLSPDGTKIAESVLDAVGKRDVWVLETDRGTAVRLTADGQDAGYPMWSRDGKRVIYSDTAGNIYSKDLNGIGSSELLVKRETAAAPLAPLGHSSDGTLLVYGTRAASAQARLWNHSFGPSKSNDSPLLGTNFTENGAQLSPDGHWLAYASPETGGAEIYAVSFPKPSTKVRLSNAGGTHPRWRKDGRELFYISMDGKMTVVPLDISGNLLRPGTPKPLFQTRIAVSNSTNNWPYDVAADGQKFLINSPPPDQNGEPITLYLNWTAALPK